MVDYQTSSAQQTFLKLFFILLLLIAYFSPYIGLIRKVSADPYYPEFNINNCQLSNVNGVSYSSLGSGVEYNPADIRGVDSNWITSHRFTDVATPYYPDAHRYDDIADRVSVPPNSTVNVGMWVWNYTTHDVYINSADIFTSRQNPVDGDITNLGAGGEYSSSCWSTGNGHDCRLGKMISVPVQSTYSYHGNDTGKIIYSFNTIQPIQLLNVIPEYFFEGPNLKIKYTLNLKNVSTYNLCNINVSHNLPNGEIHNENVCINANSSVTISYIANLGTNYPLTISNGSIKVTDPNRHTEIVASSYSPSSVSSDFRSIVVWRDDKDHGSPAGVYGAQPGWGNTKGTFGIELIPYSFNVNVPETNLYTKIQSYETITNLTAIENGRVQINSLDFLPGDEIQYTYLIKNIGKSKTNINFSYQIEKDNEIYENEIWSSGIKDNLGTITQTNSIENDLVNVYLPEFNVNDEREIKINIKVHETNFESLKEDLLNYGEEILKANELKSTVLVTNTTNSDSVDHKNTLNMKLADANISIAPDKLSYENYEEPKYNIVFNNNSIYRITLNPRISFSNQESDLIGFDDLFEGDGIIIENNSNKEFEFISKFSDQYKQTSATLSLNSMFVDENNNIYPLILNNVEIGVKQPKLTVSKRISGGDNYTIGDLIGYEIEVKNEGDGVAKDVNLRDQLNDSLIPNIEEINLKGGIYNENSKVINWNLNDINSNEKVIVKFALKVNKESKFNDGDKLNNKVIVKALNEENEKQSESTANLRCASVKGIAWEDNNRNQIIESNEKLLSNQTADVLIDWKDKSESLTSPLRVITDENGIFILNCVPYNKIINVKFTKPLDYFASSSPVEYSFLFNNKELNLGNLSEIESLTEYSNVELVDNNQKVVLMGLYNEEKVLAVTGEETTYGLLSAILFLLPVGLLVLKRFKFGKFVKESITK